METVVILLVLAVLLGLAVRSIYRDAKSGGCCGGCSGCRGGSGSCSCQSTLQMKNQ